METVKQSILGIVEDTKHGNTIERLNGNNKVYLGVIK
jgi:hypothetical protein